MNQAEILTRCTQLRTAATKFYKIGMTDTCLRTIDEHNTLAGSFNRKSKRFCLLPLEVHNV